MERGYIQFGKQLVFEIITRLLTLYISFLQKYRIYRIKRISNNHLEKVNLDGMQNCLVVRECTKLE